MKIDKGIPIPDPKCGTKTCSYPFAEMDIGDSLFIPDKKQSDVSGLVYSAAKRLRVTFTTRYLDGGTRVWRTA